jgi:hypothetical protein
VHFGRCVPTFRMRMPLPSSEKLRQYVSPKCSYTYTKLHGVTSQEIITLIFSKLYIKNAASVHHSVIPSDFAPIVVNDAKSP